MTLTPHELRAAQRELHDQFAQYSALRLRVDSAWLPRTMLVYAGNTHLTCTNSAIVPVDHFDRVMIHWSADDEYGALTEIQDECGRSSLTARVRKLMILRDRIQNLRARFNKMRSQ